MKFPKIQKPELGKIIYYTVFIAALLIFCYAAVNLIRIGWDYYSADKEYQELEEYVSENTESTGQASEAVTEQPAKKMPYVFKVDFDALQKKNPDCIGWIRFPNLDISYPILQGEDNDYYLKHTFTGQEKTAASIFMDYQNAGDFTDENTFIYGHNMKDKSMFGRLNDYADEEFYKENSGFYIYTPEHTYYYEIFSCYVVAIEQEYDSFLIKFSSKEEYGDYIETVKSRSEYDTGIEPDEDDSMITLMTCNRAGYDYRFLVHAIRKDE